MVVNRNQLIQGVIRKLGRVADPQAAINEFLSQVQEELLKGNEVSLKGFFHMETQEVKPRIVRNFQERTSYRSGVLLSPRCKFSKSFIRKIRDEK